MNELLRNLLMLPDQASSNAKSIDTLHYVVIGATLLGAFGIALLTIYLIVRYRARSADHRTERMTTGIAGESSIIGGILVLFVAFWVVGYLQYVKLETAPADAMPVYVTAKQWMWKFAYADGRKSMDVLTVPVNRPVKLIMTSRDVIHSFYVPAFRMKQDAVPGRYVTAWFEATQPGTFEIYCAEYCGLSHSRMLGTVLVLPQAAYEEWLENVPHKTTQEGELAPTATAGGDLADQGREVAVRHACFACHTIDGQRHMGPTWAGLYSSEVPLVGGAVGRADEAYLTKSMMEPGADIVDGYKNIMPTYQGSLPEPEVAALVEYIKSLQNAPLAPVVTLPEDKIDVLGSSMPEGGSPMTTSVMPGDAPGRETYLNGGPDGVVLALHDGPQAHRPALYLVHYCRHAMASAASSRWCCAPSTSRPTHTIMDADTYNRMFTLHGVVMVFLFMIPAIPARVRQLLPADHAGRQGLAFPRLNLLSFYVYVVGAVFVAHRAHRRRRRHRLDVLRALQHDDAPRAVVPTVLGIFILGFSSILTGINFIVTTHTMRAKGMGWMRHAALRLGDLRRPASSRCSRRRSWACRSCVVGHRPRVRLGHLRSGAGRRSGALPAPLLVLLAPRRLHHDPARRWAWSARWCRTFARKNPSSYKAIAYSTLGIAFVGFLAWGHHMFVAGMSAFDAGAFGILSMLVAIFTAIKVFTWVLTMTRGSIVIKTPLLYFFAFLFLFVFGGMTGVAVATTSLDVHWHDTYFVVAHFHFIMVGGTLTAFLAALHYWFPKMIGRMYSERCGPRCSASSCSRASSSRSSPSSCSATRGCRAAITTTHRRFQVLHVLSTVGAWLLGVAASS